MSAHAGGRGVLALVAIVAIAAYTRLANWAGVFTDRGVFFGGLDSYYHVRRAELALSDFPWVPSFDAWTNFPTGARLDWPWLFDLTLATFCRLGAIFVDGPRAFERVAPLFNPLLGVLTCVLVYRLGQRLAGPAAGLVAALLAAVMPMLTGYAIVGRVDHHAAEPLLLLAPLLLLGPCVVAPTDRRTPIHAAAAGVALALAIAVWPGALVVAGLAYVGLAVTAASDDDRRARATVGVITFGAALITMIPLSLAHPWAADGRFVYFAPSWLQPGAFAIATVAWSIARHVPRVPTAVVITAVPIALGAVAIAVATDLRQTLVAAFNYIGGSEAQISQVVESRGLFADGVSRAAEQYTSLLVLWPLALAVVVLRVLRAWRTPGPARSMWHLFVVWLVGGGVLAVAQLRFGSLFAPTFCVAWGVAAVAARGWLANRTPPWAATAIVVVTAVVALLPTLALHRPVAVSGTPQFLRSHDALRWLATVAPGDPLRAEKSPAFGVMARWQWGHWITQVGRHANIANPLGQTATNLRGVRDSVRYFLTDDAAAAHDDLARMRARYVLATPLLDELGGLVRHARWPIGDFIQAGHVLPRYFRAMSSRLLHFDGRRFTLEGARHPPLRRLRLVYESVAPHRELGRQFSYAKVFERVRGARLRGAARPGAWVALRLGLRTNVGRRFVYRDRVRADRAGRFELRLPYANGSNGAVIADPAVALSIDNVRWRAVVTDAHVRGGHAIRVVESPPRSRVSPGTREVRNQDKTL